MFEYKMIVEERHVQPVYDHVHHADALFFLEQARLAFLESMGFPREGFMEAGLFWVIAGIQVEYKREVKLGEIVVTCDEARIERKSLKIKQRILNARGKVAVEAEVTSMLLSKHTGRSAEIPQEFVQVVLQQVR
jgi:YbgC/YbaW family acyl-CoA thioester hydrolase